MIQECRASDLAACSFESCGIGSRGFHLLQQVSSAGAPSKSKWGSDSKGLRSSTRSKSHKGSKGGKGGIKRNFSFDFHAGDGVFDGASGRRRSLNVRAYSFAGTPMRKAFLNIT